MGRRGGSRLGGVLFVALTLACAQERLQQGRGWEGVDGATVNGAGGAAGASPPRDAAAGRLVGDASRVDARPAGVDAGASDDAGRRPPRLLSLVLDGAPWYATQSTQGIAADAEGKVYVADYAHVFMVDGATVSTYLTAAEAAEAADPGASTPSIGDLDIGPDGRLYFITSWFSTTTGMRLAVMRSSQPHVAEPWIDVAPTTMDAGEIAVIDDGLIGLVSRSGFWTFSDAGGKLIYDPSLVASQGCACEDLAADRSGTFLYQSGC